MSEAVLIGKIFLWGFVGFLAIVFVFVCWFFIKALKGYFDILKKRKLQPVVNEKKKNYQHCPKCGKEVNEKNKFCRHCGVKLK